MSNAYDWLQWLSFQYDKAEAEDDEQKYHEQLAKSKRR